MPSHLRIATTLAALLLAGPVSLHAQQPGTAPPPDTTAAATAEPVQEPVQEPEPDRWGAEVGFALNGSGGNEELTVLTTEVKLTHLETEAYELSLDGRFRYGRSEGKEVANNVSGAVVADLWPEAGWSPFLFATAERDRFRKLDARLNGGAGLKRTFYRREWDEASLSAAVLYDYENTDLDPALGEDDVTQTMRWSWRARGRYQVREGTRFEQVVFYQPAWDQLDDYLVEARSSARVALTSILAFTASALYKRDSTPAPDVGADDWAVALGLSLATTW